ncbi:MAG TPA: fumarylacetoacetase [Gemmatimonadaceae bacterium]|jgi:fumarylacetoacetase
MALNDTHRVDLASWVESAQTPGSDFPIQNLPFGVFKRTGRHEPPRVGVAIGDQIVDVATCLDEDLLIEAAVPAAERCRAPRLNELMAVGPETLSGLRRGLSELLRVESAAYHKDPGIAHRVLVPMYEAELRLPATIDDYTDFYASIDHARNVGSMFRPSDPLLPNYKYVPIGYHGRASSVVVSDTHIRRPSGQVSDDPDQPPFVAPTRRLDYEAELGIFIGLGNALGSPIPIIDADRHIFGLCLLNDWSARDIQAWEYQPLGPFLSKSFATSISPWIVTLEALEPFRAPAYVRPDGDPPPLPYLLWDVDQRRGAIDINVEVYLATATMRQHRQDPVRISRSRFTSMYWTIAQFVAHHTSNGCNLHPGDLFGSGTISGPEPENRGCLLERTWRGRDPVRLPNGESRSFLADGDEVIMRASCERPGFARIGFGDCCGMIVPAL